MVKIVHFSDLHGTLQKLPEADLYIGTGDLLPNSSRLWLWPEKSAEKQWQEAWIAKNAANWSSMFASPDAPLVLVKGNHDFVDISSLFAGHKGSVYEFKDPEVITVAGLKIAGMRGVLTINGIWADEKNEYELENHLDCLKYKDFDILLTHGPSFGILDEGYGSKALLDFCQNKEFEAHLHGHCHLDFGVIHANGKLVSNAATGFQIIDIKGK